MIPAERRTTNVRLMPQTISESDRGWLAPQFGEHPIEPALELETGGRPAVLVLNNFGDIIPALVLADQVGHFHAELLDIIPIGENVSLLAHRTMPGNDGIEIEIHGCV